MTKKIVAIHQPNYLPWFGYFYKIWLSDVFIFHDNVELTKQGYTRRTNIRKGSESEKTLLSVPLRKHSDFALIKDLEISYDQAWTEKHLNKIKAAYQKAPFFKQHIGVIESILQNKMSSLAEMNIELVKKISDELKFETEFYRSSELPVKGKGSDYNLELCKYFEASHYACGKGAKKYQDESSFKLASIEVLYNDFYTFINEEKYKQDHATFLNGMSIVDSLFNIGCEGVRNLINKYPVSSAAS